MSSQEYDQILQKMMSICSRNEKCVYDIEQKLKRSDLSEDDKQKILSELQEGGFIDHDRYVEAFINDKLRFNHWGKRKIAYTLKNKQIDESLIQAKLDEINPEFYEEILNAELNKKLNVEHKNLEKREKEKIIRYLLQKGFEYGKIFDIIEKRTSVD
jgi:regulatory protein